MGTGLRGLAAESNDEIEVRGLGEGTEVTIAGDQLDAVIQAELSDHGVAETGSAVASEHGGPKASDADPEVSGGLEERQVEKVCYDARVDLRIAEELCQDRRRQGELACGEGLVEQIDVLAGIAF